MSEIRLPDCSKVAINWKNDHGVTIFRHEVIVSFLLTLFCFSLSSLVTGPSFMSISSLVLELWQFLFIWDWPKVRKSEIPPSEFCSIFGECGEQGLPNLARTSLIKCYWMLQNARVTAFTVFELLWENQLGGRGGKFTPPPTPD